MKKNKALKVLATSAVLASVAAPFTANAATENVGLTYPVVSGNGTGVSLGTVRLTETDSTVGSISSGDQFTITLPDGVEFTTAPTASNAGNIIGDELSGTPGISFNFVSGNKKSVTFEVLRSSSSKASIEFKLTGDTKVDMDGVAAGDVKVDVYAPGTGITPGSVTVAKVGSSGTKAVALSAPTVSEGRSVDLGTIRVTEDRAGSLKVGDTIELTLPSDLDWDLASTLSSVNTVGFTVEKSTGATTGAPVIKNDSSGNKKLVLTVKTVSSGTPGFIDIKPVVDISSEAELGDVQVKVGGDASSATVVAGVLGTYDLKLTAPDESETLYAGRKGDANTLTLKEGVKGTLIAGRTIVLELPQWARWADADASFTEVKGSQKLDAPKVTDNDRHKLSFTVNSGVSATDAASTIDIKDLAVVVDADAPEGDIIAKISGTAGATGEVKIGKVQKPVTVSAELKDVKIGLQSQVSGDITIKEAAAGVLKARVTPKSKDWNKDNWANASSDVSSELVLAAPAGVKFTKVPTVTVADGDIKVYTSGVKLNSDKDQLIIPIDKVSTKASSIKLSDVQFTLDRTVPEGKLTLDVTGNALDQVQDRDGDYLTPVVKVDVANVVTPAPTDTTATNIVFKLNSKTFTVDGKEIEMDAAPLVAWDRAFLPVRFAANALNVADDQIVWDDKTNTATIFKGDRVITAKVGDKFLTVNGVKVPMEVPVYRDKVKTNNRVMIPIRYLANALNANIEWNKETSEIKIEAKK